MVNIGRLGIMRLEFAQQRKGFAIISIFFML